MVGTIEDVVKKAEQIAADVSRSRGQEKKAEASKKEPAAAAPTKGKRADTAEILATLKKMAEDGRAQELKRAAEIAAAHKDDGELRPGWSFPKKAAIEAKWDGWNVLFETQSKDLEILFREHFEESVRRQKEAAEAERAEISG